jgi:hypothetical protein
MGRNELKRPIGWVLIGFSIFLIFGTLGGKYGGGPPLPQLVPLLGVLFVVLFIGAQIGLCLWFRTRIGLALIACAFLFGFYSGGIAERSVARDGSLSSNREMQKMFAEQGLPSETYDWTRHKLIGGVCLSALAIGFGFVTEKL